MSAIDDLFRQLRAERKAFMPFVTAGDPDLEFTVQALAEMIAAGRTFASWASPTAIRSPTVRSSRLRTPGRSTARSSWPKYSRL